MSAWIDQSRRKPLALVLAAVVAVAVVVGVAWGAGLFSDSSESPVATGPAETSEPENDAGGSADGSAGTDGGDGGTLTQKGGFVPEPMSGQAAIDELGDRLAEAAEVNDMSAEELENLLESDPTVQITPSGHIVFKDPGPAQSPGN